MKPDKLCDVFISYSHLDYQNENEAQEGYIITKITEALSEANISFWLDREGIYSGDEYASLIANAIKNCHVFLFISSRNSNASDWICHEIIMAKNKKKKIIPFCIDDAEYNDAFSIYLEPLNKILCFADSQQAITKLINDINIYLSQYKKTQRNKKKEEITQRQTVPGLVGMDFFDILQTSIIEKKTLKIQYQSYHASRARTIIFFPYILKEYRNRWFALGSSFPRMDCLILALDRIQSCDLENTTPYVNNPDIDINHFYDNVIGVSKTLKDKTHQIYFWVNEARYKYLVTKPIHPSQQIAKKILNNGCIFRISVVVNLELFSEFLSFGNDLRVLSPTRVANRMKQIFSRGLNLYDCNTRELLKPLEKPHNKKSYLAF